MSLFIIVERYGAERRFLRMSGLFSSLGLDRNKILTTRSPTDTYFSIFSIGDRHACKVEESNFKYRDSILNSGQVFWLEEGDIISGHEYVFKFHRTSTSSEILAAGNLKLEDIDHNIMESESIPWVHLKIANLESRYPLIADIPLTVGSDANNIIPISLDGISPRHFQLEASKNGCVKIQKIMGDIQVSGYESLDNYEINTNSQIILEPCGIALNVTFPEK